MPLSAWLGLSPGDEQQRQLERLRRRGVLTEAEFQAAAARTTS